MIARPRVRNAITTRQAMLDAARRQFARESYENVGLREIAGAVGVDPALVSRYFGSKEELFVEVLHGDDHGRLFDDVTAQGLPEHFVRLILDADEDAAHAAEKLDRLLIILHSASSPKASAIVRQAIAEGILDPVVERIGGEDAPLRASLALAVLMGMAILRNVMVTQPVCRTNDSLIRARLLRLFENALNDG
ncbi:MAG: TetR family transcriptional regulator [Sphingomonas sp.]